ncbi:hypothetical protein [Phenylobacterium sp.]|uniref:hypothetical protein n=1 Tax=Phenylobacterium sp. TaxID=1871053 RepID=UPI002C7B7EE5|nr:hypothetical protein [Phenylobacterium sp.]HLZ77130.1 hypothetical protein [Phenylobacterium sp.]
MTDLEHLQVHLGSQLEASGGVFDRLDYNRLRCLGVVLRNRPHVHPDSDWDFPPSSLQDWVKSYEATRDVVRMTTESGLASLLAANADAIRTSLSKDMIPAIDALVIEETTIEGMIAAAKVKNLFTNEGIGITLSISPTGDQLAEALRVELHESIRWAERRKVDPATGAKRLQLGALIGKAAAGGALATANLALGALAGLHAMPSLNLSSVTIVLGVVGSSYTGLAGACDALRAIGEVLEK